MKLSTKKTNLLRQLLARHLRDRGEVEMVCEACELPLEQLNLDGTPEVRWHTVLAVVERRNDDTLRRLLDETA